MSQRGSLSVTSTKVKQPNVQKQFFSDSLTFEDGIDMPCRNVDNYRCVISQNGEDSFMDSLTRKWDRYYIPKRR